ncbi:MAG: hypothetical protein WC530_09840 [Candidatus Omnitrophota bacterium]|jgi:hypothetical protein
MKTIAGISELIVTKLEGLVDGSSNRIIPEVLGYPSGTKTMYPSAEVLPTAAISTRKLETTGGVGARLERVINFQIKLYQEAAEASMGAESLGRVSAAVDAILSSFDTDPDLSDEVAGIVADDVIIDYAVRFPNAVATINLRCVIIVP